MITNLFSIFDPSTSINSSINWLSLIICFRFTPLVYWNLPSRQVIIIKKLIKYILSEFYPLNKKSPQTINMVISLFLFIILNNLPGLLPYIFTATSHISLSLSIAFCLWLAFIIYGWLFNTSNLLIHLIPNGTPAILIPFIVLVETIRNTIRPLTLAIRLSANIIAGHLLVSLLTSTTPFTPFLLIPFIIAAQIILASLEIAVAIIQAYVFSVLLTLYTAERIN